MSRLKKIVEINTFIEAIKQIPKEKLVEHLKSDIEIWAEKNIEASDWGTEIKKDYDDSYYTSGYSPSISSKLEDFLEDFSKDKDSINSLVELANIYADMEVNEADITEDSIDKVGEYFWYDLNGNLENVMEDIIQDYAATFFDKY